MKAVAAIDQGTTSSRCILFSQSGEVIAQAQKPHRQIFEKPGWVEHDALEIWAAVQETCGQALARSGLATSDIAAVGITNQRETTVLWEKASGKPVANAIVWQDTRTAPFVAAHAAEGEAWRAKTGLPLATYFSGPKIRWLLEEIPGAREAARRGEILFGTIDSWLIFKLTGRHLTDPTNAGRTLLMDLERPAWDEDLCEAMGVPLAMLPEIRPSSEVYGEAKEALPGVAVAAALGDQQAALFGQACFSAGEAKCTYGTGAFLLAHTGETPIISKSGLIATPACRIGKGPAQYALEGSIAVAGALVQWLRDKLGIIASAGEIEELAGQARDSGGAVFVPAFSGLFAPHWRSDARGLIAGLTAYDGKAEIARAALEATACLVADVAEAMAADMKNAGKDSGAARLSELRSDGGMAANALFLQIQADILGLPVVRPAVLETTALGAAYAAGLAVGFWDGLEALRRHWREDARFTPAMSGEARTAARRVWAKGIERAKGWID
ncbi:MAG: glycerol kinase GlpK [Caulobacteraceae bacterium]